jgi:lipopolysaccharide export system protein LptA
MRNLFGWILWGTAAAALAQETDEFGTYGAAGEEEVTVITSVRLTFDYRNQYALFEENVVVTDPQLRMNADRLLVEFDEAGDPKTIKAEGGVRLTQEELTADSDVATYDVVTGRIELTGNPRVRRGRDILSGDRILFWRDEEKMICEPNAKLVIYSQATGLRGRLSGDD